MATNVQFPIAVHLMAGLAYRVGLDTTSAELASSINTSSSFVRRTLAKLAKAGLVETARGSGGYCRLAKRATEISLLDIYQAVEPPKVFAIHDYRAQKACIVSCRIKDVLEDTLEHSQAAMEASLAKTTVAELIKKIKKV